MKKTQIEGGTAKQPDTDSLRARPQNDSLRDRPQADSLENTSSADSAFVPLHPPVVVPHTWREAMSK
jgi:hypothetical protein